MVSNTRWTATGARPAEGSSSSSSLGLAISATEIASIWRSPPLSTLASRRLRSFRMGNSANTSSMAALATGRGRRRL